MSKIDREKLLEKLATIAHLAKSDPQKALLGRVIYIVENTPNVETIPRRETFSVIDRNTGKEADTYEIALKEEWANRLIYCDMDGWAITEDGSLILMDECGRFAYADRERFEVIWEEEQKDETD